MPIHIKKTIKILCAFACIQSSLVLAQNAASTLYQDVAHLADVWLEAQKDHANIPALMGLIVKDQKVVWRGAAGFANVEQQIPASTSTLSSVCSVSKVLTATAVMKLVDEGKLSLDDDVQKLLPDYGVAHAYDAQGNVTVRSLLTHTSGLPRDTGHGYFSAPEFHFPDKQAFLASVTGIRTLQPVGEAIRYSNVGFGLLGQLIESVTGMSYKDYMESQIFSPLGMSSSAAEFPLADHGQQHAVGYSALNRYGERDRVQAYQTRALQPATGISTSIDDMAKYVTWLLAQPSEQAPLPLVSAEHRDSMLRDQTSEKTPGSRGLGFMVYQDEAGDTWATHGGMCPGYHSFLKLNVSQKEGFVMLTNANQVRALAYANGLQAIWRKAQQRPVSASPSVDLSEYTGFYDPAPWNSQYYVSTWGDGLIFMYLPSDSLRHGLYVYQHIEGDVFGVVRDGQLTGERIEFLRDDSGKVMKILDGENAHPRVRKN